MRKAKFLLPLLLVVSLLVILAGPALAAAPIVVVTATSPGGGDTDITVTGIDSSTWNPGSVGEVNTFSADGQFTFTYSAYAGNYGSLQSYVNATSTTGGSFQMTDLHDFDILSANHSYGTIGDFTAYASGSTAQMNIGSIGSMYSWSEANYPYSTPALQGDTIFKTYDMYTSSTLTATMFIQAVATGGATMDHSSQWGFGSSESGTIDGSKSPINTVVATGTGIYQQYASSGTTLTSNATFVADGTPVVVTNTQPGGAFTILSNFTTTFNLSDYTLTAK